MNLEHLDSSTLTLFLLPVVYWVFRRLFPVRQDSGKSLEELRALYRRSSIWIHVIAAAAFVPTYLVTSQLLVALYRWIGPHAGADTVVLFRLPSIALMFAAGAVTIGAAPLIVIQLTRLRFKERYAELEEYWSRSSGINNAPLNRYAYPIFVVIGVAFTVCCFRDYDEVKTNQILVGRFFGAPRSYELSEIAAISHFRGQLNGEGRFVPNDHFVVRFKDYTDWRSTDDYDSNEVATAINHLAKMTGLKVAQLEAEGS